MNEREAHELVRSIEHLWNYDMGADGRATWTAALSRYDSITASEAIIRLSQRQRERPTLADIRQIITIIHRDRGNTTRELSAGRQTLPGWVKRWACARYFHARFDRKQDMRRFPEQGDWVDPRVPLMPEHEWADEAERISDADVYRAVGGRR